MSRNRKIVSIDETDDPVFIPEGDFYNRHWAKRGEFPYHVSIQFDKRHLCSGSLIDTNYVLTVAHCLYDFSKTNTSKIKVVVGSIILSSGIPYDVDKIFVHPSYDSKYINDDVAIIRLKKKITQSKYVQTIRLPDQKQMVHYGQELDVSDFQPGENQERAYNQTSARLKKFTSYVVDDITCRAHFAKQNLSGKYCAALYPGFWHFPRDDGSPAVLNKTYVIGILRIANPTCGIGLTQPFINVSSYLKFVQSIVNTKR